MQGTISLWDDEAFKDRAVNLDPVSNGHCHVMYAHCNERLRISNLWEHLEAGTVAVSERACHGTHI